MSQPAREFVVKIIELSLWSSDFLLGHLLLFMLTPPMLIPYVDKLHATSKSFPSDVTEGATNFVLIPTFSPICSVV